MADIQYLNYGDLQIELLALLNNLANEVQGYVAKLPWSNKRKEKFMSAYADIMNRGIRGASNSTGLWVLDVNGDPLPWDSMDKKDKEMYQEAAYFIQQQMSGLPTKSILEETEEEKKKDLPTFDNFQDNFINYISKLHFGNNKIRIGQGEEDDWNYLDERDTNGIRGTKNRAAKLAQYLLEYLNSLKEGDYNFENTPYANLDDLKNRIGTAILTLNDGTIDQLDKDALNAIGIRTSDWFNNGSGDYTTDEQGNQITYAGLAKRKLTLAEEKAKQEAEDRFKKQKEEAAKALLNVSKYKAFYSHKATDKVFKIPDFINKINNVDELADLTRKDFSNIKTNDEFKKHINKILGAYIILNNNNKLRIVHNDIWNYLQNKKSEKNIYPFKNRRLGDFKMLEGIDNIILDVKDNLIWFLDENKIKPLDSIQRYRKYLDELRKKRTYMISPSTGLVYYT